MANNRNHPEQQSVVFLNDRASSKQPTQQHVEKSVVSCVIPFSTGVSASQQARASTSASPSNHNGFLDTATENEIDALLQRAATAGKQAACLWFRVAEHSMLEETFGCKVGRELVGLVEQRLRNALRESDLLYRMSDDEYAIVLSDISDQHAGVFAQRLLDSCNGIYQTDGLRLHVTGNVGISLYPKDTSVPRQLLRYARVALRDVAKQTSKYQFFSMALLTHLQDRASMTTELVQALEEGRMVLHYQPQYSLETQQVIGVEALVRLQTTDGELLGPDHFIELAEQTGLIIPLGRWVIEQASKQLGIWHKEGLKDLRMAVNISPKQLQDDSLIGVIHKAVADNGIDYKDLELEITENEMVENLPQVEQSLRDLTQLGIRIAVDDFGTGYSSLAYLVELSVDAVKIDRVFISRISSDERTARIVKAIIAMAQALELTLTAEGIETDEQQQFLLDAGCDIGQGFGFSRPQSAELISQLLIDSSADICVAS